jgi:ATP-binding cassette subfamily B protein
VATAALTTALGVLSNLMSSAQRILTVATTRQAQGRILDVAGSADLASFDSPGFHDALTRAQMGLPRIGTLVSGVVSLMQAAAMALAATVALLILNPVLIGFGAAVALPVLLIASRRNRMMYAFQVRMTPSERERTYLSNIMMGRLPAQELRAYQLTPFLRARYDHLYAGYVSELRTVTRRLFLLTAGADLLAGVLLAGGLLAVIAIDLGEHIGLASGATSAIAVFTLGRRLITTTNSAGALAQSAFFIEDYRRALALGADTPSRGAAPPAQRASPRVEVEDLHFAYPTSREPVLRGVSLQIEPGEVVALVGSNGSGKTSLAKLLAGLYRPSAGSVAWDGVDLRELPPEDVRGSVALIFQDYLRYLLSVRDNVVAGRHEASADEARVRRAVHDAGAAQFIDGLPDGLATRLGPEYFGGTEISLGQWQRIALARVLFRDAPFVILDEPTASLDARAEHSLFTDMRKLFPGRTVLLISHRFATVREADRILVMHEGRIVETGGHEDLLAHGGLYAEMFNLQAEAYTAR